MNETIKGWSILARHKLWIMNIEVMNIMSLINSEIYLTIAKKLHFK